MSATERSLIPESHHQTTWKLTRSQRLRDGQRFDSDQQQLKSERGTAPVSCQTPFFADGRGNPRDLT